MSNEHGDPLPRFLPADCGHWVDTRSQPSCGRCRQPLNLPPALLADYWRVWDAYGDVEITHEICPAAAAGRGRG